MGAPYIVASANKSANILCNAAILIDILRKAPPLSRQMSRVTSSLWFAIALLGAISACNTSPAGECSIGADCASGSCGENGQCNIATPADGGSDAADDSADADSLSLCGSVIDNRITRDELPMAPGLKADFRVATEATFDTAGDDVAGIKTWDLDRSLANDVDIEVLLTSPVGTWFADSFPSASYVGQLSAGSDLLGVFRLAEDGLYLQGVVSPDEGLTRTELTYAPEVLLMPIPLEEGATWSTDASVSGVALGVFSVFSEEYLGSADGSGEVVTPFGTFRSLRTRIDLTRTVGLLVTTTRQYNFVSECAGIIASIVSNENEENVEFSSAAEIRRVIP